MKDRNCCCPVYHAHQEISCLLPVNLGQWAGRQEKVCAPWLSHWSAPSTSSLLFSEPVSWQPCYSKYSPRPGTISTTKQGSKWRTFTPYLWYQDLHVNKIPSWFGWALKFEKPWYTGCSRTHRHIFFFVTLGHDSTEIIYYTEIYLSGNYAPTYNRVR